MAYRAYSYLLAALLLGACLIAGPVHAQTQPIVVSSCGSLSLPVTSTYPPTQTTGGNLCTSGSGGGGGNVTITGPLGTGAPSTGVTTTLDTTDAAALQSIVTNTNSGATRTVAPSTVTTTNASSTITTGGTFQSALASNASRKGCLIENPTTATEPLFVFFGANGSATTANSLSLGAGSSVSCSVGGIQVATDNVSVTATTTGHAYVEMSQ